MPTADAAAQGLKCDHDRSFLEMATVQRQLETQANAIEEQLGPIRALDGCSEPALPVARARTRAGAAQCR